MLQISEFRVSRKTDGLKLPRQGIFVVWEWEWLEDSEDTSESEEEVSSEQHNPHLQSDEDMPNSEDVLAAQSTVPTQAHTVTFKCIGSVHDVKRQVLLSEISQELRRGQTVEVRVHPESENPYDSKAISFQCYWKNSWQTIGYVVRECLDQVHESLKNKRLLSVKLSWVKYLVCWSNSGPGFYAGINMMINGEWHQDIVRH